MLYPLDLPLEVQQTIKKLTERIECLEKQNHYMLSPQPYCKFMMPPPTSLYMEHGKGPPINNMNHVTPSVMPPVNYNSPPYGNYEIPPGAMNMSQDLQWLMVSEENITAATTKENTLLPTENNLLPAANTVTPPIKPITKVVIPSGASRPYPVLETDNDTTKENGPLPEINYAELQSPTKVVGKYSKLLVRSSLPTLAVKLANEAFFGPRVMSYCTFQGVGSYHALPRQEVNKMKEFLYAVSFPSIVTSRFDFEDVWRKCIESVGQKCKKLRKRRLANLALK